MIGNIFPNYKTNRKYSLNLNRNECYGGFPHDYFDIYLDYVAKYAFQEDILDIKEYYLLKRAITYKENMSYFKQFGISNNFLRQTIWVKYGKNLKKLHFQT